MFLFFIETFFNNHIIAMIKKAYALCALFGACATFGAGFQVLEQGASNLGSALAGSTVNANADASSAFWNPSASFAMDPEAGRHCDGQRNEFCSSVVLF